MSILLSSETIYNSNVSTQPGGGCGGVRRPHSILPRICSVTRALNAHWVSVSTSVSRNHRLSSRLYRAGSGCNEMGHSTLHRSALPAGPWTGPDEHIRPGLEIPCHTGQRAGITGRLARLHPSFSLPSHLRLYFISSEDRYSTTSKGF